MAPKKAGVKKPEAKADAKAKAKAAAVKKPEEAKAEGTKRKAEEAAADAAAAAPEPPAKEAKLEEQTEKEQDAPADKRQALDSAVGFHLSDTTLNVVPTMGGRVLATLSDGGLQYLIAGARANVGMKAGRYLFEVKIAEVLPLQEHGGFRGKGGAMSRALLRVGFSAAGSPLVLGDCEEHVYFDSEGVAFAGGKRGPAFRRFMRDQTIGVLLNLDPKSENKHTFSCFIDGVRVVQPQPLPEALHGKTLFPHVSFRNVKVLTNFGPSPMKELPFKCRTLNSAAAADVVKSAQPQSKDGKCEVVLPVGFPDEGTFDWLDHWMSKNPGFVELSDRKIIEWAVSSGLLRSKTWGRSNDKPEVNYNVPGMDDGSVRRIINSVATLMPRNYVVMEVKSNLLEAERAETLKRFPASSFKRVAHVVMGEPNPEFRNMEHEKLLKDKQAKADQAWRVQQAEKRRQKEAAKRAKIVAEAKKKAEDERKRKAEQAKKAAEEKKKAEEEKKKAEEAKEGDEKKEDDAKAEAMEVDESAKKEDAPAEEKKEEEDVKAEEPVKEEEEEEEPEETEPPKVELTAEEKAIHFAPRPLFDLTQMDLTQSFTNFSIPAKAEGFDDVRFEWQKEKGAKEYLRKKVLEKKKGMRVESLQPGEWFQEAVKAWAAKFTECQEKVAAWKASDEGKAEAKKKAEESKEELPAEKDVNSVEDVNDTSDGGPLCKDFTHEDWALLQLRFELLAMHAAYKKDVDDEDRPAIQEQHFAWYYNRYFKKYPNFKGYGVDTPQDLLKLVKESVAFEEELLVAKGEQTPEDFAALAKLGELQRRDRERRLQAGDESARIKISPDALKAPMAGGKMGGGKKGGGKGFSRKW